MVVQLKLVKGFKFEEKPFHCFGGGGARQWGWRDDALETFG